MLAPKQNAELRLETFPSLRIAFTLDAHFDQHRLPFALASLRQPRCQALRKTLWCKPKTCLDPSFAYRQSIVKFRCIRKIAHAKLIQPLQRAHATLATNYDLYQKLLRVHSISLASHPAGQSPLAAWRRSTIASRAVNILKGVPFVKIRSLYVLLLIASISLTGAPVSHAQAANSPVLQVESWRRAVLSGDANALKPMYTEGARIFGPKQTPSNVKGALDYWTSWKAKGLKNISAEVESQQEPQPGFHVLMIQLTLGVIENGAPKNYYVSLGQGYIEQGATWKIAAEQREDATRLKAPAERKDLYPAEADANKEIAEALAAAAKSHKHVLLIFGGNWCYDCHVLDEAFHTPEIAPTLNRNFVVAHIDIGEYNKNLDIAKKYEIPLERGVPAAAVLSSEGKLLVSQKNQEFEKARSLAPEDILAFLNKWKPSAAH